MPFAQLHTIIPWSQDLLVHKPSLNSLGGITAQLPFLVHRTIQTHKPSLSYQVPTYCWVKRVHVWAKCLALGANVRACSAQPGIEPTSSHLLCHTCYHWATMPHVVLLLGQKQYLLVREGATFSPRGFDHCSSPHWKHYSNILCTPLTCLHAESCVERYSLTTSTMETISCVKAVVTGYHQYRNSLSDANLVQLTRHLDVSVGDW